MNVHVILRWDWEVESKMDSDFTILGVFSDEETAQFHLDSLQREALLKERAGCFYWIETHEINKMMVGEH